LVFAFILSLPILSITALTAASTNWYINMWEKNLKCTNEMLDSILKPVLPPCYKENRILEENKPWQVRLSDKIDEALKRK
jgi:hypothetical protein